LLIEGLAIEGLRIGDWGLVIEGNIIKTERSDSTNQQSQINNQQSKDRAKRLPPIANRQSRGQQSKRINI